MGLFGLVMCVLFAPLAWGGESSKGGEKGAGKAKQEGDAPTKENTSTKELWTIQERAKEAKVGTQSSRGVLGYYRYPTIYQDRVVFAAEGDLWEVSSKGGLARRLTSHEGEEMMPRFSPDGKWIAFAAHYDGDMDVYVMPSNGGEIKRLTYRPGPDLPVAWTPDSKNVVLMSRRLYQHWNWFLYKAPLEKKGKLERLHVGYGAALSFSPDGKQVAFNRSFREFRTWKRYTGGWAQDIWVGDVAKQHFRKLTKFPGTDVHPMWYRDRIYFVSDRSGIRNLFSIGLEDKFVLQHTFHTIWDVRWPSLGGDHIVYQAGADIHVLDLKTNLTKRIPIQLATDAAQRRPRYIPSLAYFENSFDLDPKGERLTLTVRGEILQVPVKEGVPVRVTRTSGVREKFVSFSPDGKTILALSDASGEDELMLFDPLGEKPPKALTKGGKGWRFYPIFSPNGKHIVFADKDLRLWLVDAKTGEKETIAQSKSWEIYTYLFSPDSRYLAYVMAEENRFSSIFLYDTKTKKTIRATSSWTEDSSPAFSTDGKTLYFLSRRSFDPMFGTLDFFDIIDKSTQVYALVLEPKEKAPFSLQDPFVKAREAEEKKAQKEAEEAAKKAKESAKEAAKKAKSAASTKTAAIPASQPTTKPEPASESASAKREDAAALAKEAAAVAKEAKAIASYAKSVAHYAKTVVQEIQSEKKKKKKAEKKGKKGKEAKKTPAVEIISEGLEDRAYLLPSIPAGHYFALRAVAGRLFFLSRPSLGVASRGHFRKPIHTLHAYDLKTKKLSTVAPSIHSYDISDDNKQMVIRRGMVFQVFPTQAPVAPKPPVGVIDLSAIQQIKVKPAQEWAQILKEAWRLQRDFYWAADMAKVAWEEVGKRYFKLLPRLLTRADLSDVIGEMIGELGTSHAYVFGGDMRQARRVGHGLLGADIVADPSGYYRIKRVLRGAPWAQQEASPLAAHAHQIKDGQTFLLAINGKRLRIGRDSLYRRLQNKAGRPVVLLVNEKPEMKGARRIIIKAIHVGQDARLRYIDWVESRRQLVDTWSGGRVAYIHLPNMSADGLISFYRMWYPQLHKRALLIDVRGNGGGNVSQILIQKLMRRIWALFKARNSPSIFTTPSSTFHGHMAVLTNQNAGSDGDIFCRSFQILKMGKVFGTRTWGGVVGIRGDKFFLDRGMTTQPEFAWWSYRDGWTLENTGVIPDVEIDNLPEDIEKDHDRQLKLTLEHLLDLLKKDPKKLPTLQASPDKSLKGFQEKWKRWAEEATPAPVTLPSEDQ